MRRKRFITIIFVGLIVVVFSIILVVSIVNKHNSSLEEEDDSESLLPKGEAFASDTIPSIDDPIFSGKRIDKSPYVGSFTNSYVAANYSNALDVFGEDKLDLIPSITIDADSTFIMRINGFEKGMVEIKGNVTVDDTIALFEITSKSINDFLGDDVTDFSFRLVGENDLKYDGLQLGTVTSGDIFTRNTE